MKSSIFVFFFLFVLISASLAHYTPKFRTSVINPQHAAIKENGWSQLLKTVAQKIDSVTDIWSMKQLLKKKEIPTPLPRRKVAHVEVEDVSHLSGSPLTVTLRNRVTDESEFLVTRSGDSQCSYWGYYDSTTNTCWCPLDRTGTWCDSARAYTCTFSLVSPQPNYQMPPTIYDIDPIQYLYSIKDSNPVNWVYNMTCQFSDTSGLSSYVERSGYDYYVRQGNQFAMSYPLEGSNPNMTAILKVFNFNILSDVGASIFAPLSSDDFIGASTIQFSMTLSNIPTRFFFGGRLYFEVSIDTRTSFPQGLIKNYDRRFVDFTDAPRKMAQSTTSSLSIFLIALAVLGSVALVGYIAYRVISRRKPQFFREGSGIPFLSNKPKKSISTVGLLSNINADDDDDDDDDL